MITVNNMLNERGKENGICGDIFITFPQDTALLSKRVEKMRFSQPRYAISMNKKGLKNKPFNDYPQKSHP